jgi:nucleotide-binding universal stress UspA family protein
MYPAQYRALAGFLVASAVFVAIFVVLTLSAFHKPTPHDLPVGIVGSAAVTRQVEHALASAAPGAFRFRSYPSQASATAGIAQREVDGALVASGAGLRLLVTQAGGTGPDQALNGAFAAVAARSGRPLIVSDVVPPRTSDSQALSSWFVVLSVLIPSLAAGSASALAFRRTRRAWAVAVPVAAAVVSGLVAAAILDGIAGLGNYAAIAGIIALFSLAVAAPTAVLARIRPPLVALAVLVFIVAGIPVSGGPANLASFTPGFLRVFAPVLPLGIAASTIRNVVYFGGHATSPYLWTLAAWALAGVAGLILVTALRRPALVLTQPVTPPPVLAEPVSARPGHASVPGIPDPGAARSLTLVVGFDDSEPARRALIWGADLLRARPGALHVVYADHVLIDSDLSGFGRTDMDQDRDAKAARVAEAAKEITAAAGTAYTFERRQEPPADAILHAADVDAAAEPASTTVVVTGRSHHVAHRVIGSVPGRLLNESPYPVLTISLPATAERAALMVVPARPARMSAASVNAPIAADWPDALTNRMHASTLGPIDPAGNVMADSATVSMAWMGRASGVP